MRLWIFLFILFPAILFGQKKKGKENVDTSVHIIPYSSLVAVQPWDAYEKHNLKNGSGVITTYCAPLMGYFLGPSDSSNYGKITMITYYKNNLKNGKHIQFFNYPNDTASIETYKDDTLNGPFYYKNKNGNFRETGIYKKGILIEKENYSEDGGKVADNIIYNKKDHLYYFNNKKCNGRIILGGLAVAYFEKGKIDSIYTYNLGYWGKSDEVSRNYIDSTRKYIAYYEGGNIMWIYSEKIASIYPDRLYLLEYGAERAIYFTDRDSLVQDGKFIEFYNNLNHTIKETSYMKNNMSVGDWHFFNIEGVLDSTQTYENGKLTK